LDRAFLDCAGTQVGEFVATDNSRQVVV
jgi:hypothetical protein